MKKPHTTAKTNGQAGFYATNDPVLGSRRRFRQRNCLPIASLNRKRGIVAQRIELAKYPDLPWSSIRKGRFLPLRFEDLTSRAAIEELVERMFDAPEMSYYLYTRVGQPAPDAVICAEVRGEIQMSLVERPFYLHRAGSDHSFSQILDASPDGVEYQRITLELSEKTRRELTIRLHLDIAEEMKPPDPVLKLEPNVYGLGVNLRALWRRVHGGK